MSSQGDLDLNCLFCRWIRAGKAVETLGTVAAFEDGYPVTEGHLLIMRTLDFPHIEKNPNSTLSCQTRHVAHSQNYLLQFCT